MDHPVSDMLLNQVRLMRATIKLCPRVVAHNHLVGVSQAVGISIRVGIRIFSIVVD